MIIPGSLRQENEPEVLLYSDYWGTLWRLYGYQGVQGWGLDLPITIVRERARELGFEVERDKLTDLHAEENRNEV